MLIFPPPLSLSFTLTQDDEVDSDDRSALAYLCTMLYLVNVLVRVGEAFDGPFLQICWMGSWYMV